MAWRIGIDIGGTFTDVALIDDAPAYSGGGRIGVAKTPTTPKDFAQGVLTALDMAMRRHGVKAADVGLLAHATTVVTNAILEEKGARAALIATRGISRCAGVAAVLARRSLRSLPGPAGHSHSPTAPLRDHRTDRRGWRHGHTAGRRRKSTA